MTSPSPRGQYEQKQRQAFIERRARLGFASPGARSVERPVPVAATARERVAVVDTPIHFNRPYSSRRKEILAIVCEKHGVGFKALIAENRLPEMVLARAEAMWMLRVYCAMSLPQIAEAISRDHTTVLHTLRKYGPQFEQDREQVSTFKSLGEVLEGVLK